MQISNRMQNIPGSHGDFSCISRSGLLYQEKDLVIDEKDLDKFYAVVEMGNKKCERNSTC